MEVHERLARGEEHMRELDRRVEKVEHVTEAIYDLASGVKQMGSDLTEVKADVKKLGNKVNELEDKPGKASIKAWIWLICLAGGAIIGEIIDLIISTI